MTGRALLTYCGHCRLFLGDDADPASPTRRARHFGTDHEGMGVVNPACGWFDDWKAGHAGTICEAPLGWYFAGDEPKGLVMP